ncbi:Uncharacterised protein [Mycobacteroides abscessus subsp. abscessus]|nr:Uncharacterised protein [Mycobacteroides abscessus subsp. abscessus]SIK92676.1 Uncharacterised protein [Mycobacteroides abscessus subsp. abscessus]SIL98388.1 Uncharacterised protein [Mycobacteroides abscessus subsp. abscessus]SLE80416.1 Uncharacterised protein [Mycobacteroides abscessus subsp. abscessus]
MNLPELKTEGLHPDHVEPLQRALAEARALLEQVEQTKKE